MEWAACCIGGVLAQVQAYSVEQNPKRMERAII